MPLLGLSLMPFIGAKYAVRVPPPPIDPGENGAIETGPASPVPEPAAPAPARRPRRRQVARRTPRWS